MMVHDMAHINITDVASLATDDYTTHGPHLNSRGKRRLAHLTAERISGRHVSNVSSVPVTIRAGTWTFQLKIKSTVD
jgi:hypothetical protein